MSKASSSAPTHIKLVVRRLPPTLTEEIFWSAVSTWVNEDTCLWKRYVQGRAATPYDNRAVHSRGYVLFVSALVAGEFQRGFDGHIFRSKTGGEFQAVVETAPLQKTTYKAKVKPDARQGTIEDDPDFLSFLESLNAPIQKQPLEPAPAHAIPTSTPLLDALRAAKLNPSTRSKKISNSSSDPDPRRLAKASNKALPIENQLAGGAGREGGKRKGKGKGPGPKPKPNPPLLLTKPSVTSSHPAAVPDTQASPISLMQRPDSQSSQRLDRPARGGAPIAAGRGQAVPSPSIAAARSASGQVTPGPGSESSGRWRGRGRGRGRGGGGGDSATAPMNTIVNILQSNSGRGRGGRGRGTPPATQ